MTGYPPLNINRIVQNYVESIPELLDERRVLGLDVPNDVRVNICFANDAAGTIDPDHILYMNLCHGAKVIDMNEYYQIIENLREIGFFFDILRNHFVATTCLYGQDLKNLEVVCKNGDISAYKNKLEDSEWLSNFESYFGPARERILYFIPLYKDYFLRPVSDLEKLTLMHEIDHLDFYQKNPDLILNKFQFMANVIASKTILESLHWLEKYEKFNLEVDSEIEVRGILLANYRASKYLDKNMDISGQITLDIMNKYFDMHYSKILLKYITYGVCVKKGILDMELLDEVSLKVRRMVFGNFEEGSAKSLIELNNLGVRNEIVAAIFEKANKRANEYQNTFLRLIQNVKLEYFHRSRKTS
jgi:hypothetical protein